MVHEPTPGGVTHRARLWIVDDGSSSWIHPGNANARWWGEHIGPQSLVEVDRDGHVALFRASTDPGSHRKVHQLLRAKYGAADRWVRFLAGTDTETGLLTWGKTCSVVPIRLDPSIKLEPGAR